MAAKPEGQWAASKRLPLLSGAFITLLLSIPILYLSAGRLAGRTHLVLLDSFLLDGTSPKLSDASNSVARLSPQKQDILKEAARVTGATADGGSGGQQAAAPRQRCAVFNGVTFHLDVTAGMAWAFQEAGCDTDVYMPSGARGLQNVMESWFRGELLRKDQLEANQHKYDLVVMVTYPEGPEELDRQARLLLSRPPHQRIQLAVHNPTWLLWNAGPVTPPLLLSQLLPHAGVPGGEAGAAAGAEEAQQLQQQRPQPLQLLSLAPCGSAYSKSFLESWVADMKGWEPELAHIQAQLEVPWIAPLVPWEPSSKQLSAGNGGLGDSAEGQPSLPLKHLCIQGSVEPRRRDYAGAFAAASHPAVLAQLRRRKEHLLLVGSYKGTPLGIPPELEPFVKILSNLKYKDYYNKLSRCRAILTAFGSDMYLINKTSSTMAAALQVGVPLLTEERVLEAYQYFPQEAAFVYSMPPGAQRLHPAALAAEEGQRMSQWMYSIAAARAAQLQRAAAAAAAARRRLAEEWAEGEQQDEEEAEEEEATAVPGDGEGQEEWVEEEAGEGDEQQQGAGLEEGEEGEQPEPPPAGSYAAALLRAFDDAASRAAHDMAWRAKRAVMQRNVQVARRVLQETALL